MPRSSLQGEESTYRDDRVIETQPIVVRTKSVEAIGVCDYNRSYTATVTVTRKSVGETLFKAIAPPTEEEAIVPP